jgi:hypothetical protein
MVKNWEISKKHNFFIQLTKNLQDNKSSLASIRLFKGLIKDQKDRVQYGGYNSSPTKTSEVGSEVNLNL